MRRFWCGLWRQRFSFADFILFWIGWILAEILF